MKLHRLVVCRGLLLAGSVFLQSQAAVSQAGEKTMTLETSASGSYNADPARRSTSKCAKIPAPIKHHTISKLRSSCGNECSMRMVGSDEVCVDAKAYMTRMCEIAFVTCVLVLEF